MSADLHFPFDLLSTGDQWNGTKKPVGALVDPQCSGQRGRVGRVRLLQTDSD